MGNLPSVELKTHRVFIKSPVKGEDPRIVLTDAKIASRYSTCKGMKFNYELKDEKTGLIIEHIDWKDIQRIDEIPDEERYEQSYGDRFFYLEVPMAQFTLEGEKRDLYEVRCFQTNGKQEKELWVRYGYLTSKGECKYQEVPKNKALGIQKVWCDFFKVPENRKRLLDRFNKFKHL